MFSVLRNRDFALHWIGQLISIIGDWLLVLALPFYIFDLTNSILATGGMFIATSVPRLLLGSLGGVFADRWNRRTMMIVTDLWRASILLLINLRIRTLPVRYIEAQGGRALVSSYESVDVVTSLENSQVLQIAGGHA